MANEEAEFSANGLFFHRNNPGQSSHESTDSGCCDAEALLGGSQKTFDTFYQVPTSSQSHHPQNPNAYSVPKRTGQTKQRASGRKEEITLSDNSKEGALNETGGPSYKYLTWREKDRRRRFREEWKHLWLVIPHGMYEVMCLVCNKIMTQRKLDTIKRHTIRRHAELLSMSDLERQRLYHDLVAHHFRRGGNLCSESDCFSVNDVPKLRTTSAKTEVRRHQRLSPDFPPSIFRSRVGNSRRCEVEKTLFMPPQSSSEQLIHYTKPPIPPVPPMNPKLIENILSNEQLHSVFTKYLMGFQPNQFLSRGKYDPSMSPIGRRNPLPHTCGMGTPHAFQIFKKPPSAPIQRALSDTYLDPMSGRAPLDMTASVATSPMQITPDDLSVQRYPASKSDHGASLTERLMRLMNTWDSAAINFKPTTLFPPPPPLPPSLPLLPSLLSPQVDGTTLMLNR
ncbi:hypothetical protein Aperf_G00000042057 [Anoplocephala perfoliata]